MSRVTIGTIISVEANAFNGLTKTMFTRPEGGETIYMFSKPENVPAQGDQLDGDVTRDKGGKLKFTKAKADGFQGSTQGATGAPQRPATASKVYKADPDKLKQEMTLETARNQSIQRQVAVKGAVELIVAGKREYDQLHTTYVSLMELLTEHDWQKFGSPSEPESDGPPLDNYADQVPTEAEVDKFNLDEVPL